MAITAITPVSGSTVAHGDSFSFTIDNTYTTLQIKVQTETVLAKAYDTALGGAQAGYTVSVTPVGGTDVFTVARDAGWDKSPQIIYVEEDESGATVVTNISYALVAEEDYPQGTHPYNAIGGSDPDYLPYSWLPLNGVGAPGGSTGDGKQVGHVYIDTAADEHYVLADATLGSNVWDGGGGGGGVSDHGALTGLADDDHTQYLRSDGFTNIYHVGKAGCAYTDIQTAVTQAIADGLGDRACVLIHPGLYTTTATIDVPAGMVIKGISKGAARLTNSTTDYFRVIGNNTFFEDLLFEGGTNTALYCINMNNYNGCHVRRCDLLNNGGTARQKFIKQSGATWITAFVEDCVVDYYGLTGYVCLFENTGGAARFVDTILNNVFFDCFNLTGAGGNCEVIGCQDWRIRNSTLRGNANCTGIKFTTGGVSGVPFIKVSHCWIGESPGVANGTPLDCGSGTSTELYNSYYKKTDCSFAGNTIEDYTTNSFGIGTWFDAASTVSAGQMNPNNATILSTTSIELFHDDIDGRRLRNLMDAVRPGDVLQFVAQDHPDSSHTFTVGASAQTLTTVTFSGLSYTNGSGLTTWAASDRWGLNITPGSDHGNLAGLGDDDHTQYATVAGARDALLDSEVDANIKTLVLPASTTISAFGRTLVDDTTAALARTTLDAARSMLSGAGVPGVSTGDGYPLGTTYADTTNDIGYVLVDDTAGVNVWWTGGAGTGLNTQGFGEWKFDTVTTDSDPGNGKWRLNNADETLATFIYIDDLNDAGLDTSALIENLMVDGAYVYIQRTEDSTESLLYEVTAAPTDGTGYWKVPVTYLSEDSGGWIGVLNKKYAFIALSPPGGAGGGDVTGPGASVLANAIASYDGTLGLTIKESNVLVGAGSVGTGTRTLGTNSVLSGGYLASAGSSVVSSGDGSVSLGYATGASSINATGLGSVSIGYVSESLSGTGATITNSGIGSFVVGATAQSISGTATINATSAGVFVGGYAAQGGLIEAVSASNGGFSHGYTTGAGSIIRITGAFGAVASGSAKGGGTIIASDDGAFATGAAEVASGGTSADIAASGLGSFAGGDAQGVVASGVAQITASGQGSFAWGSILAIATTVSIAATATNSVQFGLGTNSTANSLQVGSGVKLLGPLTTAPAGLADGMIWTGADGKMRCRTNGTTRLLGVGAT